MTNVKESKAPNNKGVIIFGISFGIVGLIILAIVGSLFLGAPDVTTNPERDDAPSTSDNENKISQDSIPEVTNFTVTQDPNSIRAQISFSVEDFPKNVYLEYRIENDDKRILSEGNVTSGKPVEDELKLSAGDKQIALKLRASDSSTYTNWETVKYADVSSPEGDTNTKRPVNDAYFATPWALKEDSSSNALEEALHTAYGIDRVKQTDYCAYGNQDEVSVGEIFPPTPSFMDPYELKYDYSQISNGTYRVYYYWCETPKV
jgi:hypothetical protein